MSIAAANVTYLSGGPTADKQIMAFSGLSAVELAYIGTATFTGDGAASTAVLNFIDGTAALNFTPSGFIGLRCGGSETAGTSLVSIVDVDAKTATVKFSAAPANAATVLIAFAILK